MTVLLVSAGVAVGVVASIVVVELSNLMLRLRVRRVRWQLRRQQVEWDRKVREAQERHAVRLVSR